MRRVTVLLMAGCLLAGCALPQFDGERAFRSLERQCAFGPRAPGTVGHAEAGAWLVQTLEGLADEVAVQRFVTDSRGREIELTNVIASFRPDERERVLLAAHWDTRPVADLDPDPAQRGMPIPGANDGASGTAVLLELAALMHERKAIGVDKEPEYVDFAKTRVRELFDGTLRYRQMGKPIHEPTGRERVSKIPPEWKAPES